MKILLVSLLIFFLSGCGNRLKDEIIKDADQKCVGRTDSNCLVVINSITKFHWDNMYIFPDWTTSDSIGRTVGFFYIGTDVPDDHSRMIFTTGNRVVHEEDFISFDYKSSTISFPELSDSVVRTKLYRLTLSTALFKVEKGKTKGSCNACFIYSLTLSNK